MSAVDTLTDGRLELARSNVRLALGGLDGLRAWASGLAFCGGEWQEFIEARYNELGGLLRGALEALE